MADEFKVHRLNEAGLHKAELIAEAFDELLTKIDVTLDMAPSRERSLVVTKLQEACFWAKKAMATQRGNQL